MHVYICAVISLAASESKNAANGAISSGAPASISKGTISHIRVSAAGAILFAFTPYLFRAKAALFVRDMIPPFAAE